MCGNRKIKKYYIVGKKRLERIEKERQRWMAAAKVFAHLETTIE